MKAHLGSIGIICLAAGGMRAASLSEAEFTRVINDVKILPVETSPSPAKVGDRITGKTAVSTGVQSRAELRFPDKTLTRLGANSVFRMDQSTRTVELEKGVILLQVPKQLGGAKVRTAAVTAAVTGTTLLVEFTPDGFIKIIVIEGEVDVFLNERRRTFRTLVAGDLWITRADDKSGLPLPVQVDLKRLQKTSKLLDPAVFEPLGNAREVLGALEEQGKKMMDGELLTTAFQIEGRGREVTLTQGERQHVLGVNVSAPGRRVPPPAGPTRGVRNPVPPDSGVAGPNKPITIPETTVFDNGSSINTIPRANAFNSAAGTFVTMPGTNYDPEQDGPFNLYMYDDPSSLTGIDEYLAARGPWFVFKGDEIYISGNLAVDSTGGPRNLLFGATGNVNFTGDPPFHAPGIAAGNRWTLDGNTDALVFTSQSGSVNYGAFELIGTSQDVAMYAFGPESDVNIAGSSPALIRVPQGTFQADAGRDVNVSGASIEARTIQMSSQRDIKLGGTEAGNTKLAASESIRLRGQQGVRISSSSQLRRLAALDNSQVFLDAVNGNLEIIEGSSIEADVVTMGSQRGDIKLLNSSVAAREIKARVMDTGGTLMVSNSILGNGANPSDLIRLYGEGAGGVRFMGDTTLRGTNVDIAGVSVTIDPGTRVRVANPTGTRVFADSHNFNNGTHGNFTGLGDGQAGARPVDVNKLPYASRPAF